MDRWEESVVVDQSVRQSARLTAGEVRAQQRQTRAGRDRRVERLAVEVLVAIAERDQAAARAGTALAAMTEVEGLSLREAVEWCGGQLTVREAARLRQQTDAGHVASAGQDGDPVGPAGTGNLAGL